MAHCSRDGCSRWRPDVLVERGGLGLFLDDRWFCSASCLQVEAAWRLRRTQAAAAAAPGPTLRLGTVLMRQGVLTPSQIKQVVAAQQTTGLRFGAQAVQLGLATRTNVLQALSAQQGVSYLAAIDTDRVRSAPGALTRDQVKALGVVPFHQNGNDLLVACAAPVPRAAIAALESLLRVTVEPFLVTDADLERLVAAYGGAVADLTTTASPVRDVDDGASRIAAMAARLRAVQMTTARIARFTWVRINADGQASTMLVPPAAGTMETESWLAATTQH